MHTGPRILLAIALSIPCATAFAEGPLHAAPPCQPGDPLCDGIAEANDKAFQPAPVPQKPSAPKAAASDEEQAESDRQRVHDVAVEKGTKAARDRVPKSVSKAAPAVKSDEQVRSSYTERITTNGDQFIKFDDDALNQGCFGHDRITVVPRKLIPFTCFDYYMGPVLNRLEYDAKGIPVRVKNDEDQGSVWSFAAPAVTKAYRNALKCLDPCRTEEDLDYLAGCANIAAAVQQAQTDPVAVLDLTAPSGCGDTDRIDAIVEHRFADTHTDREPGSSTQGQCVPSANRKPYKIGNKTDVVLMIDNSEGMNYLAETVTDNMLPRLVAGLKAEFQDARIILTTHNIGDNPVTLRLSDPLLLQKAKEVVQGYFSAVGDEDERPLRALATNLEGVIRPDANVYAFVITDEKDKSEGGPARYLARLRKLTTGNVTISATAPGAQYFIETNHQLDEAVAATGGMKIDPYEGFLEHVKSDDRLDAVQVARPEEGTSTTEFTQVGRTEEEVEYYNRDRERFLARNILKGLDEKLKPSLEAALPKREARADPAKGLAKVYVRLNGKRLAQQDFEVDPRDGTIRFKVPVNMSVMNDVEVFQF